MMAIGVPATRADPAYVLSLEELIFCGASEEVELAILKRVVSHNLARAIDRISFRRFSDFRAEGVATFVEPAFRYHVGALGWSASVRAALTADVCQILAASEVILPRSTYTVRLERVTDDACRRFHKDNTDFRIITTYRRHGTQWARVRSGTLGPIRSLERFDIGMFLGERSLRRASILHRSPPIRTIADQRLLLVIDVKRSVWRAAHSAPE